MSGSCPPVMAGVKRVLSQLLGAYTNIFAGLQWVYVFFMDFYAYFYFFMVLGNKIFVILLFFCFLLPVTAKTANSKNSTIGVCAV